MAETIVKTRATEVDHSLENRFFPPTVSEFEWDLTIDVYEQRGSVIAKMVLLGMNPDNLDIFVDEDTLRVSGRREEEKVTREKEYTNKVVHSESFSRVVDLPKIVDASRAFAEYKDGILHVTMPVTPYTKEKPVRVNIGK